jgi:hypothetical protein
MVGLILSDPSGGGQRADPRQKHDPAERMTREWRDDLDKPQPGLHYTGCVTTRFGLPAGAVAAGAAGRASVASPEVSGRWISVVLLLKFFEMRRAHGATICNDC